MDVLVLGGTGVMGTPLVDILSKDRKNHIDVISRHSKKDTANLRYITGNAFDVTFLKDILKTRYDAIVDFLWYDEKTMPLSLPVLLSATDHYISLSSAAVYVDSNQPINEDTPRILDTVSHELTEGNHEYHLLKARIEDIVKASPSNNWTIVRPHVTFNKTRIPFCTWEMNVWLFRAMNGLPLAVPVDCLDKKTTLTYGFQVASQIKNILGKKEALGQIFQLGSEDVYSWGEILDVYNKVLSEKGSRIIVVNTTSDRVVKELPYMKSRFQYDRLLNRTFSTNKYKNLTGDKTIYPDLEQGFRECVTNISYDGRIGWQDAAINAMHDRIIDVWMPMSLLNILGKYTYVMIRIGVNPSFVVLPIRIIRKIVKILRR